MCVQYFSNLLHRFFYVALNVPPAHSMRRCSSPEFLCFRNLSTSSLHLIFGFPFFLFLWLKVQKVAMYTHLSLRSQATCPAHPHFWFLIVWRAFLIPGSFFLISFVLMRSFILMPNMDLIMEFCVVSILFYNFLLSAQVGEPYVRTGATHMLNMSHQWLFYSFLSDHRLCYRFCPWGVCWVPNDKLRLCFFIFFTFSKVSLIRLDFQCSSFSFWLFLIFFLRPCLIPPCLLRFYFSDLEFFFLPSKGCSKLSEDYHSSSSKKKHHFVL